MGVSDNQINQIINSITQSELSRDVILLDSCDLFVHGLDISNDV